MKKVFEGNSFYSELDKDYKTSKSLMNKKMKLVASLLNKGKYFLDIGSGSGELISKIIHKYQKIIGIEINDNSIKILKEKFKNYNNVFILKTSVKDIKEEKFDICTTLDVLEHLENPKTIVKHIYNLLNSNGQYIITVPNWYDFIVSKLLKLNPYHITCHTIYGWKKILQDAGFKIELARSVEWPIMKSEFLAKKLPFFGKCLLFVCKKQ